MAVESASTSLKERCRSSLPVQTMVMSNRLDSVLKALKTLAPVTVIRLDKGFTLAIRRYRPNEASARSNTYLCYCPRDPTG